MNWIRYMKLDIFTHKKARKFENNALHICLLKELHSVLVKLLKLKCCVFIRVRTVRVNVKQRQLNATRKGIYFVSTIPLKC
jgi:hypothetical protein